MKNKINYFKVLNALGDGVICIDENRKIIYSNEKAIEIIGLYEEQIESSHINDVFNVTTKNDGNIIEDIIDEVFKLGKVSGLRKSSYFIDGNGNKKYLSASISRIECEDYLNRYYVVISFRDITRIKGLEVKLINQKNNLQVILDSLPMGIIMINNSSEVKFRNQYIKQKFVSNESEILLGDSIHCINSKFSICGTSVNCKQCKIRQGIDNVYLENMPLKAVKTQITHNVGGKITTVDYQITFVKILGSEEKEVMVILRDITKQNELERNMKMARVKAEEANFMKSNFIANMSHEIRTPLNGIIGMIDLTRRKIEDKDMIENLDIAKQSSKSLLNLINNILDLSKMEANKFEVYNKPFSMALLLNEIMNEHRQQAEIKKNNLTFNTNIDPSIKLNSDRNLMKQILTNLVGNSLKFTDGGSVKIDCVINKSKDSLNIIVNDDGIGIEEKFLDSLFESFTQADGSFTRKKGGTGLGLAITKQIVELFNGNIRCETEYKKGTSFIIDMPIEEVSSDYIEVKYEEEKKMNNAKGKILLIEDDIINQIVMNKQLLIDGYDVDVANNGLEGVEKFKVKQYDLILTDIQMPIMNGLEVITEIRKIDKKIPVIALTALALKQEKEKIMTYGFDRYVIKPVDLSELSEITSAIINSEEIQSQDIKKYYKKSVDINMLINEIEHFLLTRNDLLLDKKIHELMEYFESINKLSLKSLAFKMTMAIRKEQYHKAEDIIKDIILETKDMEDIYA